MQKFAICSKLPVRSTAGSKAVVDADSILTANGYRPLYQSWMIPYADKYWLLRKFNHCLNSLMCYVTGLLIKTDSEYFLQWPSYNPAVSYIYKSLLNKRPRLKILIHDINILRDSALTANDSYFEDILRLADTVIAHSESMKMYLVGRGIESSKIRVLTCFDYLTDEECPSRKLSNEVVFAGNLIKSKFLDNLKPEGNVIYNCYGIKDELFPSDLIYKGKFSPDRVSVIEGSWGLVWDGDSIETCSGAFGKYLMYNAPHKLSLYMVSGLPVFIWRKQALAEYVVNNRLGYAIDSLMDIPDLIASCTSEEYDSMHANVKQFAQILKSGGHLKDCL